MATKKKPIVVQTDAILDEPLPIEKENLVSAPEPKFPVGSIVVVAKNTAADLNGFKLFPQYKKYTYTVEAYDAEKSIYSLRRLNLSLKLKEADIVAPSEKESCPLARRQY